MHQTFIYLEIFLFANLSGKLKIFSAKVHNGVYLGTSSSFQFNQVQVNNLESYMEEGMKNYGANSKGIVADVIHQKGPITSFDLQYDTSSKKTTQRHVVWGEFGTFYASVKIDKNVSELFHEGKRYFNCKRAGLGGYIKLSIFSETAKPGQVIRGKVEFKVQTDGEDVIHYLRFEHVPGCPLVRHKLYAGIPENKDVKLSPLMPSAIVRCRKIDPEGYESMSDVEIGFIPLDTL